MAGAPKISLDRAAIAAAYGDLGYTARVIAPQVGISTRSVAEIIAGHGRWGEVAEKPVFARLRMEQKAILQSASMLVAAKALDQVEAKITQASAYQAAGIYGLLRTHERLDAGEPTEITASVNIHAVQGLDRLAALLSQSLLPESNDVSGETIEINPQGNRDVKT